jgi:hypothetical protein
MGTPTRTSHLKLISQVSWPEEFELIGGSKMPTLSVASQIVARPSDVFQARTKGWVEMDEVAALVKRKGGRLELTPTIAFDLCGAVDKHDPVLLVNRSIRDFLGSRSVRGQEDLVRRDVAALVTVVAIVLLNDPEVALLKNAGAERIEDCVSKRIAGRAS